MDCLFLTSYTLADQGSWIRSFHTDLECELSLRLGRRVQGAIDTGPAEREEVVRAASTAPTMIALLSDAYFSDRKCGQQWNVFTSRYPLRPQETEASSRRNTVLPVLWSPLRRALPGGVAFPEGWIAGGIALCDIMRTRGRSPYGSYRALVGRLASRILEAQRQPLAQWFQDEPEYAPSAFGEFTFEEEPSRIGVSYVRADTPWAEWIKRLLVKKGYQARLMPRESSLLPSAECDFFPGEKPDKVIVVLSHNCLSGSGEPEAFHSWSARFAESMCDTAFRENLVWVTVDREDTLPTRELQPIHLYGLDDETVDRLLSVVRSPTRELTW